jgi:hypothetical protein
VEAEAAVRRPVRGVPLLVVASMVALALVGVFIRSFTAAESGGRASPVLEIVAFVLGVWLPLFALIYACVRSRVAVVALAFCVGLSVNLVFLTHAMPAAAVTDNSSVFTFANTTAYSWPSLDMKQNYTPSSSTATNCPSSAAFNWQCSWTSDTFTSGQSLSAGTAQSDLYLENNPRILFRSASGNGANTNTCTMTKPSPIADGDVMLAACVFRDTGTTVTSVPTGWNLVSSRIDSSTTISLIVYSHVVASAASEPASYVWNLGATVKLNWVIVDYLGVDTTTPIDVAAGQATPSSNDHAAPSVTPTNANGTLVTFHSAAMCSFFNPPPGMTERKESTFCTQANSTNDALEASDLSLDAVGPTGTQTASLSSGNGPAVGATMSVVLKASTAARTCNVSVQLSKPIRYRSSDSNVATNATSIAVNKPAGVVNGDVMVASISFVLSGMTFTPPAGWTQVRVATNGGSGVAVFVKAASGEPASYTWGTSGASNLAAGISAYIGVDNVTPVDADNGGTLGNFTSVTTVTPATMLVVSSFKANGAVAITWTPPAGMTERVDRVNAAATFTSVEQADALWAPAAASGNRIAVPSDSTQPVAAATVALRPAAALIGSATVAVTSPAAVTLFTSSFATSAVTFATGDFLQLDVYAPNDSINCGSSLSYDATGTPSKLTLATNVPEGVAGLLLLAPALPIGLRWWKRRRP